MTWHPFISVKLKKPDWPYTLLAHALFLQLATFVVRPAASYRAIELGVNPGLIGLIAASFAFLPLFAAVVIGRASDSGHNSAILIIGSTILIVTGFGFIFFAHSVISLIILNLLLGLGHLLSVIGQQSKVAQGDNSTLDSAFGLYTFAGSVGQTLGPVLIVIFGGDRIIPDTGQLFVFYLMASVILLGITLSLSKQKGAVKMVIGNGERASLYSSYGQIEPSARKNLSGALLISLVVIGSVDVLAVYLPVLGLNRNIPAATIGVLLSVRSIATVLSRFYLGPLSIKFGRNRLMVGSVTASALFTASLVIHMPLWLMSVSLFCLGFALGIGQPLTMTIITIAVPSHTRGTWLALRLSANRVGQTVLPATIGLCSAVAGVSGVFGANALVLGCTAIISGYLMPRKVAEGTPA